ncbi:hypothetical protein Hanom_Chr04g00282011 [Helianthus anomalus]
MAKLDPNDGGSKMYIPKKFYRIERSKTYIPKYLYMITKYITLLREKFGGSGAPCHTPTDGGNIGGEALSEIDCTGEIHNN